MDLEQLLYVETYDLYYTTRTFYKLKGCSNVNMDYKKVIDLFARSKIFIYIGDDKNFCLQLNMK